jgi:AraC family transcriptional regulator
MQTMIEALDDIEQHLTAEIQVADIAAAVSYSLYHFCRIFGQVVHHNPYDYLMRRRLSEAARRPFRVPLSGCWAYSRTSGASEAIATGGVCALP